jgi:arylformamidase
MEIHREHLESLDLRKNDILLLKTKNSSLGYQNFRRDFVHLKYDAAEYLVQKKIKTLGFDYLSVKKFGGDDEVHELLINNLTLIEGINLKNVQEGNYYFIGLALRLKSDGSPARAILIEDYNL